MSATLPKPDPCLVNLRYSGDFGWVSKKRRERDWREQRKCEFGCGEKCLGLRRDR